MSAGTFGNLANMASGTASAVSSMEAAQHANDIITGESAKMQMDSAKDNAIENSATAVNSSITQATGDIKDGVKRQ